MGPSDVINWLFGRSASATPTQGPTYTASPRLNYPTSDDVDFARKNDYSYGQPWAPEFEGKSARLLAGDPNKVPMPAARVSYPSHYGIDPDLYAKAALAVEGSGLAKLGFDPNRTVLGNNEMSMGNSVIHGLQLPESDEMWVYAKDPSAIVHESIHRGIEKLKGSPFWKKEFDEFSQDPYNEYVVRQLMENKMGDPEANIGKLSEQQRNNARWAFNQSSYANQRTKTLQQMEDAAAQYIAAKHPGGPR